MLRSRRLRVGSAVGTFVSGSRSRRLVRLVCVSVVGVLLAGVLTVVAAVVQAPAASATPTYRDTVMADSPQAYWRLGDSGGSAADETGHGNTGTFASSGVTTGASGAIAGDSDTAVTLNGSSGDATVANSS